MYNEAKGLGDCAVNEKVENLSDKISDIQMLISRIEDNLKYPIPENCSDVPQPTDKLKGLGLRLNSIVGRLEEIVKITNFIG